MSRLISFSIAILLFVLLAVAFHLGADETSSGKGMAEGFVPESEHHILNTPRGSDKIVHKGWTACSATSIPQ